MPAVDETGPVSAAVSTVLISGPVGTGKRRLARAAIGTLHVPYLHVTPGTLASDRDTSAILEDLFEAASRAQPCALLLDGLDRLTSAAEPTTALSIERRLASIAEDPTREVFVFATVSHLDELNTSLRRPGVFDQLWPVHAPNLAHRCAIVRETFEAAGTHTGFSDAVVEETLRGFDRVSAADIRAVARRAMHRAQSREDGDGVVHREDLQRAVNGLRVELEPAYPAEEQSFAMEYADSAYTHDANLRFQYDDEDAEATVFDFGGDETDPSELQERLTKQVSTPDVGYDDVGGLEEAKRELREAIEWPRNHPHLCDQMAIDTARGVLLHGPPGNGKTLLAKAIANETDSSFLSVKGPEVMDKWVGESQKFVAQVFEVASENAPAVVFIDEIDSIATHRGDQGGDTVTDRVVNQLLLELDGLEGLSDVVVVGATNRLDMIDEALLRPGRFGLHLHVPKPDEATRRDIFAVHTRDRPTADAVTLDWLVGNTDDDFSGADVAAVCESAARNAMRRHLDGDANQYTQHTPRITRDDFATAFADREDETDSVGAAFQ
nr:AAA family ATPase [Haloarchaeobius amylolyticus]